MLTVDEARARILATIEPVGIETIPLEQAAGRVLAEPVISQIDLPSFDNSSVDGFALRATNVSSASREAPAALAVTADIVAGSTPGTILEPGTAARITTGAPLPAGADAVVMLEDTDYPPRAAGGAAPARVAIYRRVATAENVRPQAADLRAGETVFDPGQRLRPVDLGMLALLGKAAVRVYRRPTVAILSSGDELLPVDAEPQPGKVHDANSYMLAALASEAGAHVIRLGIAADSRSALEGLLEGAASSGADMILSSAGVSVGALDFVREVVQTRGSLDFWRVNMRPGKPLAFGRYRDLPFFGLPGNPVSAFVGFLVFVAPAILRLSGTAEPPRRLLRARAGQLISSDGRESYLRAILHEVESGHVAHLSGHQGSGNLLALTRANALLIIPSGVKSVPPGEEVIAWLL
jgi:molybdopterin molybdotransferase